MGLPTCACCNNTSQLGSPYCTPCERRVEAREEAAERLDKLHSTATELTSVLPEAGPFCDALIEEIEALRDQD